MKDLSIVFLWIENARSERLARAQFEVEQSCAAWGLRPMRYRAGPDLVPIGEVLKFARSKCDGEAFVWLNSDVILTRNPFEVPDPKNVHGFVRREVPSGEICYGVDMYYTPIAWWDDYLSRDIPDLYLGASYVDWWISRAMQKIGAYENLTGYIDHETHPKSAAAGSDRDRHYQHNFRAYNSWAKRNECDPIPAPPYLFPKIGHVWGVRNAIEKICRLKRQPGGQSR